MDQFQQLLRQLSLGQRLGIAGAALATVGLLVALVVWAGQPNYQPAFTSLSASDAGAVSAALRTAKIPFQVADAGSTILVPAGQLSDARVAAASAGISTDGGGQGFALFDKSGFGMSEFDQQVTYQRAIEGELTKTIQSMDGVASARVAVVQAQQGLFSSQDKAATASVVLKMRNGQAPSGGLVRAIVSTVSGSVAGLTADNVTVVDDQGRVLAGGQDALPAAGLAAQQGVESQVEAKVQALVDSALGAGHSSVAVAATMDTDKVEQQITTYTPVTTGNYTPVSVQRTTETYAGAGATGAGGIVGAGSNVPGLPTYPGNLPVATAVPSASPGASPSPSASPGTTTTTTTTANGGYVKNQETVNYDLSQNVQRIIREPGSVKRLSVAVLIDQKAAGSITPDSLKTSIAAAIGADTTRGDVVSVTAVPFAAAAAATASGGLPSGLIDTATGMASSVVGVLVGLVLLFLVWRNLRALRRRAEDAALVSATSPSAQLTGGYGATGAPLAAAAAAELPAPSPQARIQERLRMVADEQPDALLGLMHGWLREDGQRR